MHALLLNAGRAGSSGSSAVLCGLAEGWLVRAGIETERSVLAEEPGFEPHRERLARAELLVFATGTYWDSWSSALARFLEEATPTEGGSLWLGKPVCVLVSAHEVGAKGVLSRLQGVLVTMGCLVAPMSGVVVTRASELARAHASASAARDLWGPADIEIAIHNTVAAARGTREFRAWEVDRDGFGDRWLAEGELAD